MEAQSFFELMRWGSLGWLDELVFGTGLTFLVALVSFLFGLAFGAVAASSKVGGGRIARGIASSYTTVFRSLPDLLVIYLFYFGGGVALAAIAEALFDYDGFIALPGFLVATLAIGLVSGAYQTEVIRGAWYAVPQPEIEAARAFGLSGWTLFRRIIAPQVLCYAVPGMGNIWQLVLKESALVAVVGLTVHIAAIAGGDLVILEEIRFSDLLRQAYVAAGSTRQPFPFYIVCVLLYLAMTTLSTVAFKRAEAWATRGLRPA